MLVRPATPADTPALAALAAHAFRETYRALDDPREIQDYIDEHFAPEVLAAGLAEAGAVTLLLVDAQGSLSGYARVRTDPAPECVAGASPVHLDRLYLDPSRKRGGLGTRLMDAVLDWARAHDRHTIWLGVDHRNAAARAFYARHGFTDVGIRQFLFGGRLYDDPVMARPVD